jgi:tetratricopeptide (TPR) repeat protein
VFDPETLLKRGLEAYKSHRPEEALDLLAQAVAEARWVANPALLAHALMTLGQVECEMKHPATALDCYSEAASVCEHAANLHGQAEALARTAEILRGQGKTARAEAACNQVIALCESQADAHPLPHASALRCMALLKDGTAEAEELHLLWLAASALYEAAGDGDRLAECKSQLAFLLGQ